MIDICSERMSYLLAIITSGLLFVQSFYSVDVITNALFRTVEVGNTKLLCIADSFNKVPTGDYYVTNLQYITIHKNFEKNFEKMLNAVEFTENDILFIAGEDHLETRKNIALAELYGRNNTIEWNKENGSFNNKYISELPKIHLISSNDLWGRELMPNVDTVDITGRVESFLNSISTKDGRVFVYFSPFFQSDNKDNLLKELQQVFEVGKMNYVETWGNRLEFCELFVKPWTEIDTTNWNCQGESLSLEQKKRKEYYSNLQKSAVNFVNRERDVTAYGDTIAVTIAAYEDDKWVHLGYTSRGVVLRTITLGTNQVFTKIEEALVNQKIGEEVSVVFTFPEDYRNYRDLAGRALELRITINAIQKEVLQ